MDYQSTGKVQDDVRSKINLLAQLFPMQMPLAPTTAMPLGYYPFPSYNYGGSGFTNSGFYQNMPVNPYQSYLASFPSLHLTRNQNVAGSNSQSYYTHQNMTDNSTTGLKSQNYKTHLHQSPQSQHSQNHLQVPDAFNGPHPNTRFYKIESTVSLSGDFMSSNTSVKKKAPKREQSNKVFSSQISRRKKVNFVPVSDSTKLAEIRTLPPFPPNWNANLETTVKSLAAFKLFTVDRSTQEFATIAALMDKINILTIEQIVNPDIWSRFVNTRKDMLKSKSDDFRLLSKLGFDETEIMKREKTSGKHQLVADAPYDDNLSLLFHCTNSSANVDSIFRDGLDERMGRGGILGKGIYFSDDPFKSMQYDCCGGVMFIFGVLLGDCLSVNHMQGSVSLVREPEKLNVQKRHYNDFFFDSIVGQIVDGQYNEYVIFNRYQCCPLYKITYSPIRNALRHSFITSYKQLPAFSWIPKWKCGTAMPNQSAHKSWPLFAKNVFEQMGVKVEPERDEHLAATPSTQESIDEKLLETHQKYINEKTLEITEESINKK